jgi:hypothetical protein
MRPRLIVVATLAGAIVLFAWQTISHAALGLPEKGLQVFPNDSTGSPAHVIRALAPQNGVYFSSRGVFAAIDISADYADKTKQFVPMMLKQLFVDLAVVLVLVLLVPRIGDSSIIRTGATYGVLALAYQGMIDTGNAIWWNFPLAWTLGNMLDQLIAFFLVGMTIAAVANRYGAPRIETAERPVLSQIAERYAHGATR